MNRFEFLRPTDGLLIHAASVLVPTGALLLLGHSGAGKSTLCRLLSRQYPIVADDLTALTRQHNGTWLVASIEQLARRDASGSVPLHAVVRIFQSETTKLASIPPRETCRHLLDALFEIMGEEREELPRIRTWFRYAGEVSRNYDGWQLEFRLGSDVIESIREEFGPHFIDGQG